MKRSKLKKELLEFAGVISHRELKRNPKLRRMIKNLKRNLMMFAETEEIAGRATMLKFLKPETLLQN